MSIYSRTTMVNMIPRTLFTASVLIIITIRIYNLIGYPVGFFSKACVVLPQFRQTVTCNSNRNPSALFALATPNPLKILNKKKDTFRHTPFIKKVDRKNGTF